MIILFCLLLIILQVKPTETPNFPTSQTTSSINEERLKKLRHDITREILENHIACLEYASSVSRDSDLFKHNFEECMTMLSKLATQEEKKNLLDQLTLGIGKLSTKQEDLTDKMIMKYAVHAYLHVFLDKIKSFIQK